MRGWNDEPMAQKDWDSGPIDRHSRASFARAAVFVVLTQIDAKITTFLFDPGADAIRAEADFIGATNTPALSAVARVVAQPNTLPGALHLVWRAHTLSLTAVASQRACLTAESAI